MRLTALFTSLLLSLAAQAQVTTAWVNSPGGIAIATDAQDNAYTVDWDYNPAGDIYLNKRDADGNSLWRVAYDNTDTTRHEVATWVDTDSAGNILVSGTIRSGYSSPVNASSVLMKFDPAGRLLWRNVYENSFDGSYTKKLLLDAQDNIYVLGMGSGPFGYVTKVKKFTPEGTPSWTYFDAAGIGAPLNFKLTPDNHLLIVGRAIYGSVNGYAKIDLSGNVIWNRAGINSLTIGDAAGDSAGNTYFVDGEYVTSGGGIITRFSTTGTQLWQRTHVMSAQRVEVGSDNQPVLSGYPNPNSAGAAFMKYDGNGNVLWENLDADGPNLGLLLHAQMKMDDANSAYLAAGTLFEMAICKIYSDGSSAWTATVPGSYAYGFDFGQNTSVYVVGGNTAKLVQTGSGDISADIAIGLSATPASANVGDTVSYQINVTNHGPDPATDVVASGSLPACNLGSIAVGASASCTAALTADISGTLTQNMSVSSALPDPVTANNSASVSTPVLATPSADISLTMTDAPDPVRRTAVLTYTLTVSNTGPDTATNVTVTDSLPSTVSFVRALASQGSCTGSSQISCAIGSLSSSASATVTISIRPRLAGSLSNTANASANEHDPNSGNNSATVTTTVNRR